MKAVLFKHYESPAHTAASNSRLSSYTLDFTQHIYTSAFNRIHVWMYIYYERASLILQIKSVKSNVASPPRSGESGESVE